MTGDALHTDMLSRLVNSTNSDICELQLVRGSTDKAADTISMELFGKIIVSKEHGGFWWWTLCGSDTSSFQAPVARMEE